MTASGDPVTEIDPGPLPQRPADPGEAGARNASAISRPRSSETADNSAVSGREGGSRLVGGGEVPGDDAEPHHLNADQDGDGGDEEGVDVEPERA